MSFGDYFLCEAPFARYPEVVKTQVYHDASPKFFGSILAINSANPESISYSGINMPFYYQPPTGGMSLYIILLGASFPRLSPKLEDALKTCALWYATVLERSSPDKRQYVEWGVFTPYNLLTPHLYIIEFDGQDTSVVSYPGGIKTFTDKREMDGFLSETLKYSDAQLETGSVNRLATADGEG